MDNDGYGKGGTYWLANGELPGGGVQTSLQSFSESYFPLYHYCGGLDTSSHWRRPGSLPVDLLLSHILFQERSFYLCLPRSPITE